MYNILKDEYGFSTRGINSWWGDIVSKTKTAARQGIQAISDFTNPQAARQGGWVVMCRRRSNLTPNQ